MSSERPVTSDENSGRRRRRVLRSAEPWCINPGEPDYPARLNGSSLVLHGIGNRAILREPTVALICSVQCPGSVIIKTFDAIRELRDAGVVIAGGFHSPMEKECLEFLLRGKQPLIVAPARGLAGLRLPSTWRSALDAGRLLVTSPFGDEMRRTTMASALKRNEFIAALANAILIPHATPGGRAETLASKLAATGKALYTFEDAENHALMTIGAKPYCLKRIISSQRS